MKRINGFLEIKDFKLIRECDKEKDGWFCFNWIEIEGKRYLFKKYQDIQYCYKEVIWGYILRELQLTTAHYDLATFLGHQGVISEDYNYNQYPKINLNELITEKCKQMNVENICDTHSDLMNRVDIGKAINHIFKTNPILATKLNQELVLCFIIQLLTGNSDSNGKNSEIILSSNPKFAPFYDFSFYGTINLASILQYEYLLKYQRPYDYEKPQKTVQIFLETAPKKEIELLREYIEKFQRVKIFNTYEKIEEDIHAKLPEDLKKVLLKQVPRNSNYIEKKGKKILKYREKERTNW